MGSKCNDKCLVRDRIERREGDPVSMRQRWELCGYKLGNTKVSRGWERQKGLFPRACGASAAFLTPGFSKL